MSLKDFSAVANSCLTSPYAEKVKGPNPSTQRGSGLHINFHPKETSRIIYPSGKYIIVRNLDDPNDTFIYRGHATTTTVAKISPNGFWIASGDISGKVRIWAWDNPEHILRLETSPFSGPVADLDWDFEAKRIVAVGEGSTLLAKCFVWDTGNTVGDIVGHTKRVLSCAFKPSRPFRIMTGSEDTKTVFHAGPPFKLNHSIAAHSNFVNCVRYAANGSRIVSVGSDKKIQFYNGSTGEADGEIVNAHAGSIYSATFSPDSSKLLTASADKTVKLWDLESLTCEQTINFSDDPQVGDMQVSVVWTPTHVLSLSLNGAINLLDLASSVPFKALHAHQVSITSACIDPSAQMFFTGSFDGVVCAHDVITDVTTRICGKDRRNVNGGAHTNMVSGLVFVNDTLISVGWDDTIRFADPHSLAYHSDRPLSGQPSGVAAGCLSGLIAVSTLRGVDFFLGTEQVAQLTGISYQPTCVAVSPAEDELAVGGDDYKTHIYSLADISSIVEVTTIETRSAVSVVAYSPAGEALAIGDSGRQIEVYERGTWEPRIKNRWVFHTSRVTTLAWSPSGRMLASGSLDENIYIWSFEQPLKKLQFSFAHMAGVTGVSFIGEDKLISAGNDNCIVTWRVPQVESWS